MHVRRRPVRQLCGGAGHRRVPSRRRLRGRMPAETGVRHRRRDEDSEKDVLLEIVSDKYCRDILECIKDKPKSTIEIFEDTCVPMSTIYRRIQTLCDSKLFVISGTISEDGKKFFLYKSKVKSIHAIFSDGKVNVDLVLN